MSEPMSVAKAGLVLGAVIGGGHLCWAVLVAFGLAQSIMDFILWMHFIKPIFVIATVRNRESGRSSRRDRRPRLRDRIAIRIDLERSAQSLQDGLSAQAG